VKIHLVHGIRTGPDSVVKNLIPYLAGFDVRYVDYGYEYELETRIVNPMIVGAMLPYIDDGDIAIGHSNGCAIIYELMSRGAPIRAAAFINGALEQNFVLPAQIEKVRVYWNAGDEITEAAKIGAAIGVTDRDWGELGHAGYSGSDPRVENVDCGTASYRIAVSGHSDFFTPLKLASWGPDVNAFVREFA